VGRAALWFFLTLSLLSLLMVVAMVRFTMAIISIPERPSGTKWWGITYLATWAAIVGLLLWGAVAAGTPVPQAVAGLTLVAVGWGTFQAFWLWLWFSLERTNARATRGAKASPFHDAIRHRAGQLAIGGLVVVTLAVIQLGYLHDLGATMLAPGHRTLAATLTVAALGFTLLLVGGVRLTLARGHPMSHAEIEEQVRDIKYGPQGRTGPLSFRRSAYRIFGPAEGSQAEQEVSLAAMKAAWRSGAWRRDSSWRTVFMMTAGGLMMLFGGFGSVVVAGPALAKILCGGALIYTLFQLTAAFRRA
jgi:hypothetical protein